MALSTIKMTLVKEDTIGENKVTVRVGEILTVGSVVETTVSRVADYNASTNRTVSGSSVSTVFLTGVVYAVAVELYTGIEV